MINGYREQDIVDAVCPNFVIPLKMSLDVNEQMNENRVKFKLLNEKSRIATKAGFHKLLIFFLN